MDEQQEKIKLLCDNMIKSLGISAFIVLGYETADGKLVKIVTSATKINPHSYVKAITWALFDFVQNHF